MAGVGICEDITIYTYNFLENTSLRRSLSDCEWPLEFGQMSFEMWAGGGTQNSNQVNIPHYLPITYYDIDYLTNV